MEGIYAVFDMQKSFFWSIKEKHSYENLIFILLLFAPIFAEVLDIKVLRVFATFSFQYGKSDPAFKFLRTMKAFHW